ncbi:hypothetical protein Tco_1300948 [Tanacetum coccineum]
MGGSSSQPRTDRVRSPINAFPLEELYTPDFSESLQENTGFWQALNPYKVSVEQVVTSPTKKKKATRNRQKKTSQSDDAPRQTPWTTEEEIALCKGWLAVSENSKHGNSRKQGGFWCEHPKRQEIAIPNFNTGSKGGSKRHKSTGSSSFNTESGEASINLNTNVDNTDEDEVQEIQRRKGRYKARAAARKNKGSASSSINEDALARLMVTEMGAQEKEERLAFLEIKKKRWNVVNESLNNKT